jgi:hypothetical protein
MTDIYSLRGNRVFVAGHRGIDSLVQGLASTPGFGWAHLPPESKEEVWRPYERPSRGRRSFLAPLTS